MNARHDLYAILFTHTMAIYGITWQLSQVHTYIRTHTCSYVQGSTIMYTSQLNYRYLDTHTLGWCIFFGLKHRRQDTHTHR